jgi:hypothetical protein
LPKKPYECQHSPLKPGSLAPTKRGATLIAPREGTGKVTQNQTRQRAPEGRVSATSGSVDAANLPVSRGPQPKHREIVLAIRQASQAKDFSLRHEVSL